MSQGSASTRRLVHRGLILIASRLLVATSRTAAAIRDPNSPTSRFQPGSIVATHSVSSRIVTQGAP